MQPDPNFLVCRTDQAGGGHFVFLTDIEQEDVKAGQRISSHCGLVSHAGTNERVQMSKAVKTRRQVEGIARKTRSSQFFFSLLSRTAVAGLTDRELLSGFVFKLPDLTSELKIGRWVSSCEATARLRDGASWQSPSRVVKQRSEVLKMQEMQSGEVPAVRRQRGIHAGRTNR